MILRQIEDKDLSQFSYMVGCQQTGEAIIVDPERDIGKYYELAEKEGMKIVAAVDTHIHADYLSGIREFAEKGVKVYASAEGGEDWQYKWLKDSDYNYRLLRDNDSIELGNISLKALHTPGHTPEHLSFLVIDHPRTDEPLAILTGDFVFIGDVGRPDLLESAAKIEGQREPSAKQLFKSLSRFKELDDSIVVLPGHGSGSACGKSLGAVPFSSVGYERRNNPAIKFDDEQEFVDYILKDQPAPPMYFARMKQENRDGMELYEERELTKLQAPEGKLFSIGKKAKGSLYAPSDAVTETAGSFLSKEDRITLYSEDGDYEKYRRALMKIGLDNVVGYVDNVDEADDSSKEKETIMIDVRGEKEYREENLGTKLIPHTRMAEHLDELDKDKKILLFCASGGRSESAASYLRSEGFDAESIGGIDEAREMLSKP